jgi:sugar diacid utilization regulator
MTSLSQLPTVSDPQERWNLLYEAVESLLSCVEALGLVGGPGDVRGQLAGHAPPQLALLRLVSGKGTATDEQRLMVPVVGSRLVVIGGPDIASIDRLASALGNEHTILAARHDERQIIALVRNTPRVAGKDCSLAAASRLAELARRIVPNAAAGVSTAIRNADELPAALDDASDASSLAKRSGRGPVFVDDAWAEITLGRVCRQLTSCLTLANPLESLVAYDQRRGTELLQSVRTWLTSNRDVRAAADRLCVHPNTLRYRLSRATKLTNLDLDDPAHRLVTELVTLPGS